MYTILLVEDDAALRDGLTELFTREGYSVTTAANAAEARQNFSVYIDLIILDITLPDGNGVSLCQEWRDQGITTSILFLTAKDEEFDVVRGLDAGGNDYVTKPFRMMELLSRIRALLRRANAAPQQKQQPSLLTAGGITLDPEQRVAMKNGEIIELTAKEYDLIELLVRNPRRIYSRENLMDLVWGYTYAGDYRTVDVHIRRLREKLEDNPAAPQHILTKWGVGYYLKD